MDLVTGAVTAIQKVDLRYNHYVKWILQVCLSCLFLFFFYLLSHTVVSILLWKSLVFTTKIVLVSGNHFTEGGRQKAISDESATIILRYLVNPKLSLRFYQHSSFYKSAHKHRQLSLGIDERNQLTFECLVPYCSFFFSEDAVEDRELKYQKFVFNSSKHRSKFYSTFEKRS